MDYKFCPLCGSVLEGESVVGEAYPLVRAATSSPIPVRLRGWRRWSGRMGGSSWSGVPSRPVTGHGRFRAA
jgi:hypothetical protein